MPRPAWFTAFKAKQWGKKKTSSVENINCLFLSIDTVHDCISRSFLGWSCDSSTQKNVSNSYAGVDCQTLPVKYIVLFLLIPSGCWCPTLPWKLHPLCQMLHQRGPWTTVQRGFKPYPTSWPRTSLDCYTGNNGLLFESELQRLFVGVTIFI